MFSHEDVPLCGYIYYIHPGLRNYDYYFGIEKGARPLWRVERGRGSTGAQQEWRGSGSLESSNLAAPYSVTAAPPTTLAVMSGSAYCYSNSYIRCLSALSYINEMLSDEDPDLPPLDFSQLKPVNRAHCKSRFCRAVSLSR